MLVYKIGSVAMLLTLSIFYNLSIISFHHCDAGICCTQINSDNSKQTIILLVHLTVQFMKQIELTLRNSS